MAAQTATAAEEDLPPPEGTQAPAYGNGGLMNEDETLPDPSLGGEALPEPSADRGQENAKNQVNRPPEDDEVFLPTPAVNDNINYAPVGSPAPRISSDDSDWRVLTANRPMFSIMLGMANKGYVNDQVEGRITGPSAGISLRVLNLGQTIFLHLQANYSWFSLGDVLSISGVKDEQLQYGAAVEVGVGRRFSLFGTLLRRQSRVSDGKVGNTIPTGYNPGDLQFIGEEPTWYAGLGAQWDFYVIPHGSLGVRANVEMDLFTINLTMAMEPRPRKKLSFNMD